LSRPSSIRSIIETSGFDIPPRLEKLEDQEDKEGNFHFVEAPVAVFRGMEQQIRLSSIPEKDIYT
jgi:hypothetical protein